MLPRETECRKIKKKRLHKLLHLIRQTGKYACAKLNSPEGTFFQSLLGQLEPTLLQSRWPERNICIHTSIKVIVRKYGGLFWSITCNYNTACNVVYQRRVHYEMEGLACTLQSEQPILQLF